MADTRRGGRADFLDALKALALGGVLLNHLVEEFGSGPWFTNPSARWPEFAVRIRSIFPTEFPFPLSAVQFAGWLGDSGPGVFILASAVGLTWASLRRGERSIALGEFARRRLSRIFPLYLAAHFVVLAASLAIPGSTLTFARKATLFSLLGLRFTDSLFFYISPSWWFVWLILQLYAIFPALYWVMRRLGPARFMAGACMVTFAARGACLAGAVGRDSLYFWMTGLCFATRLAEFAAGMVVADWLWRRREAGHPDPAASSVLGRSVPFYLAGLVCSFTWAGAVVSNLLVTLGLSGIFYAAWEGWLARRPGAARVAVWIGAESYGVYLIHQAPLEWTGLALADRPGWHLAAALAVLAGSFPLAWGLGRAVDRLERAVATYGAARVPRALVLAAAAATAVALGAVEPQLWSYDARRVLALLLATAAAAFLLFELPLPPSGHWLDRWARWSALGAVALTLFLLPDRMGPAAVAAGAVGGALLVLAWRRLHTFGRAAAVAGALGATGLVALEAVLVSLAPLEAGRWGEFPALEPHPTRVFALKPSQATRLRYNTYDYVLRTNSFGLAGPEIAVPRPASDTLRVLAIGDAFTMPEGVAYSSSFPALLEARLAECSRPRTVQVINAGVTGYGPREEAAQLRELAPVFRPDIVVYEFFVNEFQEVRLTREDRWRNIGFRPADPSLPSRMMARSQVMARLRDLQVRLQEGVTGRPADWRFYKALLPFYRTDESEFYRTDTLEMLTGCLREMKEATSRVGSDFVILYVPGAVAVSRPEALAYFPWGEDLSDSARYDLDRPYRHLQSIAGALQIPVIDLTPVLRRHRPQPVYVRDAYHWNAEGHRAVAGAVLDVLTHRALVPAACAGPAR